MDQYLDAHCYDFKSVRVQQSGQVESHPGAFGFLIVNQGDTGVLVQCGAFSAYLKPYPPLRPDLIGASISYVDSQAKEFYKPFLFTFDALPGAAPFVELHIVHKRL